MVVRQSSNEAEDDERADDNARPEQFEVLDKYRSLGDWDKRIARIETVERYEGDSTLRYYVQCAAVVRGSALIGAGKSDSDKDETCWIDDSELHEKAPRSVIAFLTSHLRWGGR